VTLFIQVGTWANLHPPWSSDTIYSVRDLEKLLLLGSSDTFYPGWNLGESASTLVE
jgi:hypothetical protein